VHPVRTSMDPSDHQELLQRPLVGVVPILEQYHMSFYLVIILQLQLCNLKKLVFAQLVHDVLSQVLQVLHFTSQGDTAVIIKTH